MANRRMSDEVCRETVDRVNACLREGFSPPSAPSAGRGAITEASRRAIEDGFCNSANAFTSRLRIARDRGMDIDETLYRPPQYQYSKPTRKSPVGGIPPMPDGIAEPEGEPVKVLAIGDTHDDPRIPDKERFTWFGKHAAENEVDYVVQIGDWGTWDSVSRHEDRASITGRALPSFEDDMASFRMSLMAFDRGLDGYQCKLFCTEGNHEKRVEIYENLNPVHENGMMRRVREAFAQYGWQTRPFGEFLFIEGVGFTHVPLGENGKPYGGKTAEHRIAGDATFSIVYGHSHKPRVHRAPKIGPTNHVKIVNLGCALPSYHVEAYAQMSTTGWGYGVYELTLQAGRIISEKFFEMSELRNRYCEGRG